MLRSVAAPHNFLKADTTLLDQISSREWMIARIVQTEEAIASGGEVSFNVRIISRADV